MGAIVERWRVAGLTVVVGLCGSLPAATLAFAGGVGGPVAPEGYPKVTQVQGVVDAAEVIGTASGFYVRQDSGRLLAWGRGSAGELGNDSFENSGEAVEVRRVRDVVDVRTNFRTSYALDSEGQVWSWGDSVFGLLGTGPGQDRALPKKIGSLPPIKQVATDEYAGTSYAVAQDGRLFAWGRSQQCYWLGDGRKGVVAKKPVRVQLSAKAAQVFTFGGTEAVITRRGKVYTWGLPNETGRSGNDCSPRPLKVQNIPPMRDLLWNEGVVYGLARDGRVWSWGFQQYGAGNVFGYRVPTVYGYASHRLPKRIGLNDVARLYPIAGVGTYAVLENGAVKAWGAGKTDVKFIGKRILGNGLRGGSVTPVRISSLDGAQSIMAFSYASAAATFPDTTVKAWGFGRNDSFGLGSESDLTVPTKLPWALGMKAHAHSSSEDLVAALPSGEVLWGTLNFTYPDAVNAASAFGDVSDLLEDRVCPGFVMLRDDGTAWHLTTGPTGGIPAFCSAFG